MFIMHEMVEAKWPTDWKWEVHETIYEKDGRICKWMARIWDTKWDPWTCETTSSSHIKEKHLIKGLTKSEDTGFWKKCYYYISAKSLWWYFSARTIDEMAENAMKMSDIHMQHMWYRSWRHICARHIKRICTYNYLHELITRYWNFLSRLVIFDNIFLHLKKSYDFYVLVARCMNIYCTRINIRLFLRALQLQINDNYRRKLRSWNLVSIVHMNNNIFF